MRKDNGSNAVQGVVPTVVAIGYSWRGLPSFVKDADVLLTVCRSSCAAEVEGERPREVMDTSVYRIALPRATEFVDCSDIIGTIGLLSADNEQLPGGQSAVFERTVSDVLLWELISIDYARHHPVVIVLQGPLLPKLRGRIYYRHINFHEATVLVITFHSGWLGKMGFRESVDSIQGAESVIGPLPPLSVDSSSRSFLVRRGEITDFHVEIPANVWESSPIDGWWEEAAEVIGRLFRSEGIGGADASSEIDALYSRLPVALRSAAAWAREENSKYYRLETLFWSAWQDVTDCGVTEEHTALANRKKRADALLNLLGMSQESALSAEGSTVAYGHFRNLVSDDEGIERFMYLIHD